jgi:hypothetical protein
MTVAVIGKDKKCRALVLFPPSVGLAVCDEQGRSECANNQRQHPSKTREEAVAGRLLRCERKANLRVASVLRGVIVVTRDALKLLKAVEPPPQPDVFLMERDSFSIDDCVKAIPIAHGIADMSSTYVSHHRAQ